MASPDRSQTPSVPPALTVLGVASVCLWMAWLDPQGAAGPDAAAYLRLAQQLAAGGGLDLPAATPTGVERFAVWPPGYPALVALPTRLGLDVWWASKLVGATCVMALAWLTRLAVPRAPLTAFALLMTAAGLRTFAHTASEAPFVVAMVGLVVALDRWLERPTTGRWAAVAACAWVLVATRYLGLFGAGVVVMTGLHQARRAPRHGLLLATSVLPAGIGLSSWLLRNQALTGHATGMPRIPAPEGWSTLLVSLGRGLITEAIPSVALLSGRPEHLAATVVALLALLAWLVAVRPGRPEHVPQTAWLALATGLAYLAALVALRFSVHFDLFTWRLLYPGTCMALLALAATLAERPTDALRRHRVATLGLLATTASLQLGLAGVTASRAGGPFPATRRAVLDTYASVPAGCVVGPHDTHLPWLRPDLIPAMPQHRPYHAEAEDLRTFVARVRRVPAPCRWVLVRDDLQPPRFDPSWAMLAELEPVGTLIDMDRIP